MSQSPFDYRAPLLDEQTAQDNAETLRRIAERHGITELRFASTGRLVGHLDDDRGLGDMADFMSEVEDALDRRTNIISDRVVTKPGVSPDVVAAQPL